MTNPAECRDRAAQCFQLAATAGSALQRTVLLNAANSWLNLANQAERDIAQQKPEDTLSTQGAHGLRRKVSARIAAGIARLYASFAHLRGTNASVPMLPRAPA